MSPQREYQLRMRKAGKCINCGKPADGAARCPECAIKLRRRRSYTDKHRPWYPGSKGRPPHFIVSEDGKPEPNTVN